MAKINRDEILRRGEELLAEWAVAKDAHAEILREHTGRSPAADLAIACRLGALATDDSVAVLRRLGRETGDKQVRKEVKRSLYRLKQRGVAIPADTAPSPAVSLLPSLEGYLSAVDGNGDQFVWIIKPRSGGITQLFSVINDPGGMREVSLSDTTRKALKSLLSALEAKHELRLQKAEWRYCDFLMHRAFGWARARDARVDGDYPALRGQVIRDEPPPDDLQPLVFAIVSPETVSGEAACLADSASLLEEKEFRTWFLAPERARPYLEEIDEIGKSPVVVNEMVQGERVQGVLDRAVRELFDGEHGKSCARRMFEMGYFLAASGRSERAKQAVAVGLALRDGVCAPAEIPFCRQLVWMSFGIYMTAEAQEEKKREESSLLVTPEQFRRESRRGS